MELKIVRFGKNSNNEFFLTLKKRVDEYFTSNGISRKANAHMVFKTIFMLSLFLVPFSLISAGLFTSTWAIMLVYLVAGFGVAGIGLSVMHDANHGSYSKNPKINKRLGFVIDLVGGYACNWKIQHNVLHHSFTNVDGLDEDINPGDVLRFSPHQPHRPMHRFQHIYAWFLYGFMTLSWMTVKDFKQLKRYNKKGLLKGQGLTYNKELTKLVVMKALYYLMMFGVPMTLTYGIIAPWVIIVGVVLQQYTAGVILACIFQPAHVMDHNDYPVADVEGNIENTWAEQQMASTTNFAPNNPILSWYCGGLNFQVEHHLFPQVCHVHYKKLSTIVKATAEEFGLPYYSEKTFGKALMTHAKMLKKLGQPAAA
jgi:linoleoyl-CoA desaturase